MENNLEVLLNLHEDITWISINEDKAHFITGDEDDFIEYFISRVDDEFEVSRYIYINNECIDKLTNTCDSIRDIALLIS